MERLSDVVRRKFVDYFVRKHRHKYVPSSKIQLEGDNSQLFVGAGMTQFKPIFLADDVTNLPHRRVCNYQKCLRLGGKSCDLQSVGLDHRHHTFFEMLGNWSFGDYTRQHAYEWALDFLVNDLKLDFNKIHVTYYADEPEQTDLYSRDVWLKFGIPPDRIEATKDGSNFWEMGTSGPCGTSSEIFYPIDGQLVEIWNIVHIDRNRLSDTGQIVGLKNRFIDTGMGLERILTVLENKSSNYDTDLFSSLMTAAKSGSPKVPSYGGSLENDLDIKYRIVADHSRAILIAIADGVNPGREKAGWEIRKLIRRVLLASKDDFQQRVPRYLLFDLMDEACRILSNAYPDLPAKLQPLKQIVMKDSYLFLNKTLPNKQI